MSKLSAHLLFLVVIIGVITGEILETEVLKYASKPLVMVWIAVYFILCGEAVEKIVRNFALAGFFFSWLGDIVLMFSREGLFFFILGLLFFLGTQFFYLFTFLRLINLTQKIPFLRKKGYWLIPFLIYGFLIYIFLYNNLDSVLKIGVLAYVVVLLGMSVMALNRKDTVGRTSFLAVFTGSLFFVISDSLLAINKFLLPIPLEGVWVMCTYITAQYMIMQGILLQFKNNFTK